MVNLSHRSESFIFVLAAVDEVDTSSSLSKTSRLTEDIPHFGLNFSFHFNINLFSVSYQKKPRKFTKKLLTKIYFVSGPVSRIYILVKAFRACNR